MAVKEKYQGSSYDFRQRADEQIRKSDGEEMEDGTELTGVDDLLRASILHRSTR